MHRLRHPGRRAVLTLAIASALASATAVGAAERLAGPVPAEVISVIDGDTIEVSATIWLGQYVIVGVRIRGIDAPEIKGKCQREKDLAAAAKQKLGSVAAGTLRLTNIDGDKYFGRVDADVTTENGTDLGAAMLASGLARPYDGDTRASWCGVASTE
ncbi:MAG: thermonuclease family protein [Bauldia sp.]